MSSQYTDSDIQSIDNKNVILNINDIDEFSPIPGPQYNAMSSLSNISTSKGVKLTSIINNNQKSVKLINVKEVKEPNSRYNIRRTTKVSYRDKSYTDSYSLKQ